MEILKVEHLSKVYGTGDAQVVALNDVSFSVNKGEFVAIIGPSGSGKSTLLHMMGGVDAPTSGKIWIEGTDLYSLGESKQAIFRRRQIGLIYQFYNLIPVLTVEENLTLPLLLDGRKPDDAAVREMVDTLGFSERLNPFTQSIIGRAAAAGEHRAGAYGQPLRSAGG